MTAFSEPWDAAFEAVPANNEATKTGAGEIRALKRDVREREAVDHSWAGDSNDGKHNKATLRVTSDPTLDPTDGAVYAKTVSGNTELCYKDSGGSIIQLTSAGRINIPALPPNLPQLVMSSNWVGGPTVDLINAFTGSFTSYDVRFRGFVAAIATGNLKLLFGVGAGPTWQTANYAWGSQALYSDGTQSFGGNSSDASILLSLPGFGMSADVTEHFEGVIRVFNAVNNHKQMVSFDCVGFVALKPTVTVGRVTGFGMLTNATPISSLRFQCDNGDLARGGVELWGYP